MVLLPKRLGVRLHAVNQAGERAVGWGTGRIGLHASRLGTGAQRGDEEVDVIELRETKSVHAWDHTERKPLTQPLEAATA